MPTTTRATRAAIDVAPPTKRRLIKREVTEITRGSTIDAGKTYTCPALALLLAILALAGTTVVWRLGTPGLAFWIGAPLGVAAITLARRTRREQLTDSRRAMTTAAIGLATLALGQLLIWSLANLAG